MKRVQPANPQDETQTVQHAVVALDGLSPHPRNYRRHPESQVARLEASLARFGQVRSIVVQAGADGRYLLVAGHGLAEAARKQGLHALRADVIPAHWSAQQVEGYLIADNESSRGADDDLTTLAQMLQEQQQAGEALESLGYSDEELAALLDDLANAALAGDRRAVDDPDGGGDDFDTMPDASGPTRCQPGDLWQLGQHRLLVGDSTRREDVARLMAGETASLLATDPPYNVGIRYGDDVDDAKSAVEYETFTRDWFSVWCEVSDRQIVTPGCNNLARWLRWFDAYHWAPWTKTNAMTNGKVSRFWCWEPVLFFGVKWPRSRPNDVFNFPALPQKMADGSSLTPLHPCPKPLPMWADLFENYSEQNEVVADAFGGSGTAVIAAERIGRRCYAIELDPRYCDVILRRWEAETEREATLIERLEVAHASQAE